LRKMIVERFMARILILGLCLLIVSGCGGSNSDPVFSGQAPPATSSLSIENLSTLIPVGVDALRITLFDTSGRAVFGPVLQERSVPILLPGLPTGTFDVQIEYLQDGELVGIGTNRVSLQPGQLTVLDNPAYQEIVDALQSIEVSPAQSTLARGMTAPLTATGVFNDGSRVNLSSLVAWSSSDNALATVSNTGSVRALSPGVVTVTAVLNGRQGSATVTVTAAALQSLFVSSTDPTVPLGLSRQHTAVGTFSDGTQQNLTQSVAWTSTTPSVASVDSSGLATGLVLGDTSIVASLQGIDGQTDLQVTAATVLSLTIAPANPSIPLGRQQAFTVTANLSDGTTTPVTESVLWNATSPATIAADGLASSAAQGQSTITATVGSLQATTSLSIVAPVLESIAVSPPLAMSSPGSRRTYTATGTYSDQSTLDLTSAVSWASDSQDIVVADGAAHIDADAVIDGNLPAASISAQLDGVQGTASLRVASPLNDIVNLTLGSPGIAILPYRVGSNGALTETELFIVPPPVGTPAAAFDPTGRFVCVLGRSSGTVCPMAVVLSGANLGIPVPARQGEGGVFLDVPTGSQPVDVIFDPSSRFVYVANAGDNTLSMYGIEPDGFLTSLGDAVAVASSPVSLAVEPSGRFLFVTSTDAVGASQVSTFAIGPDGTLSLVGTPLAVGTFAQDMAASLDGSFLFVAQTGPSNIARLAVGADGSLTALAGDVAFSQTSVSGRDVALAVHPNGQALYALYESSEGGRLDSYALSSLGGLSFVSSVASNGPGTASDIVSIAFTRGGRYLHSAGSPSRNISTYSVEADLGLSFLSSGNPLGILSGTTFLLSSP
jgi:6-phosphogluconolactonase (cycloisomerase 2 family)